MHKVSVTFTLTSRASCSILPTDSDEYYVKIQNKGCTLALDLDPTYIETNDDAESGTECKLLSIGDRMEYKVILRTKSKTLHECSFLGVINETKNKVPKEQGKREYQITLPDRYLNRFITLSIQCEEKEFQPALSAEERAALFSRPTSPSPFLPSNSLPNLMDYNTNANINHSITDYRLNFFNEEECEELYPPRKKKKLSMGMNDPSLDFSLDVEDNGEMGERILSPALGTVSETLLSSRENLCKLEEESCEDDLPVKAPVNNNNNCS